MTKEKEVLKLKRKNVYYKINFILFSLIALGLLTLGIRFLSLNKDFTNTFALATTVRSENFTELYFENPLNLPTKIRPKQRYNFAFTIHNLENKEMIYPYNVYLQNGNTKLFIENNSVSINNNQYKTIRESFSPNTLFTKSKIVINLVNKNQQIDFWVEGIK